MKESVAVRPLPAVVTPAAAVAACGLVVAAALRLAILFRYRIDSDETQHLHVVWGWTHGLLPYRDLFDNHMPLFHILFVPFLRLAGERPEALILGRLAMLPLFALIALLTYRICAACYSPRVALPAAILGMFVPDFFLCSVELRPDVLWAAFWLAAIAILVRAPVTLLRAAAAGLMLGLAFAVSAKTSLLAATVAIAAFLTLALTRGVALFWKRAAVFAVAAVVPPALIAAYFALRGAWQPFLYCTVTHNLVTSEHPHRILFLAPMLLLIVFMTRSVLRDDVPLPLRRRRLFLLLAASLYGAALFTLWPIIETEHWLPFYPLAAAAFVPLLWGREGRPRLAAALLALELFWIVRSSEPWRNQVAPTTAMIQEALRLTAPDEQVLDLKGELVFRRRAIRPVLEKITKNAIATGRLPDTVAADVLRTHTMVAIADNTSFPRKGRAFLRRNFIDVGRLRVAGRLVNPGEPFRLEVPGRYAVVSPHGPFLGTLDGMPYAGPRELAAGPHTLSGGGRSAVLWARAAELGFSPF